MGHCIGMPTCGSDYCWIGSLPADYASRQLQVTLDGSGGVARKAFCGPQSPANFLCSVMEGVYVLDFYTELSNRWFWRKTLTFPSCSSGYMEIGIGKKKCSESKTFIEKCTFIIFEAKPEAPTNCCRTEFNWFWLDQYDCGDGTYLDRCNPPPTSLGCCPIVPTGVSVEWLP